MRLFAALLLLAGYGFAQAKPDFSGVFLRTETFNQKHTTPAVPRILEVRQTAEEIVATAAENGETAVVHYRLDGKKSETLSARLKGNVLVLKGTIPVPLGGPNPFGLPFSVNESLVIKWELSADGNQLEIRTRANSGPVDSDIYTREPSLEAARASASATLQDCRKRTPSTAFLHPAQIDGAYGAGVALGAGVFEQITRSVFYEAVISGDFFNHLERVEERGQPQFRRNGQPVTTYANEIVLEVAPHPVSFRELGAWQLVGPPTREPLLKLRFMVRWLGIEQKDLGEIESDFLYEPWRENSTPVAFYRMRIPAQNIPLTDELEVAVFSKTGEQLTCLAGHL
jgi:hypothetical protein